MIYPEHTRDIPWHLKKPVWENRLRSIYLPSFLPCAMLVVVTYRLIRQEQELAKNTAAEECGRVAENLGQALLTRLEDIKIQEHAALIREARPPIARMYTNPEVVWLAEIINGKLILPWEHDPRLAKAEEAMAKAPFAARIRSGEEEEFIRKNYARAAVLYRQSQAVSADPIQKGYAAILLARALNKAGLTQEALSQYRSILNLSPELVDEYGIPLWLYAAHPLIQNSGATWDVFEKLKTHMEGKNWLSPAAVFFVQNVIEEMETLNLEDPLATQLELLQDQAQTQQRFFEESAELQQLFPSLGFMNESSRNQKPDSMGWLAYNRGSWLISTIPEIREGAALCIVVDGLVILREMKQEFLKSGNARLEFEWTPNEMDIGESLGPSFRNLGISFSPDSISSLVELHSPQRMLYGLLLLLVLSMTFFGGYMLWRDVRREIRLAEMRSQFVSSVSHELKTPLTSIRMFAETLRMGRSKDLNVQKEYLDTIVNESRRLTRLLNNVLDFSKIEQGKRQYHMQPASISQVVQAAIQALSYPLSQQGFRLHVHIDPDIPDVPMDQDALEQAVLNLLSNAMKYSGESRDIDLKLSQAEHLACIQVVDQGVGIPPGEQSRIFDKYYRIEEAEGERSAGTGLGLALVSHIVAAHRGRIEVKSLPGKGSSFAIYLPFGDMS